MAKQQQLKQQQQQQQQQPQQRSKKSRLNPEQLPWFDDGFTFSDRERELALLDDLLSARLADVRFQRQVIRQQIVTGDFGIPITDNTDNASTDAGSAVCSSCVKQLGEE